MNAGITQPTVRPKVSKKPKSTYDTSKPRVFKTITCPLCPKTYTRSFKLPEHLLKHHCADVSISNATRPHHYLPAYIKQKGRIADIEFCICLTCLHGFVGDELTAQGSRWVNEHELKKNCVSAHPAALIAFKERRTLAIEERDRRGTEPVPLPSAISLPSADSLTSAGSPSAGSPSAGSLPVLSIVTTTVVPDNKTPFHVAWEFIKHTYPTACEQMEDDALEIAQGDSDLDDDYEFNPKEGLLDIMKFMCGYKKQFEKLSSTMKTEIEKKEYTIAQRDGRIRILEQELKDLSKKYRKEIAFTDSD